MIQSLQGLYIAIITYVATIPLKLLNLHAMYEVTYSTDHCNYIIVIIRLQYRIRFM